MAITCRFWYQSADDYLKRVVTSNKRTPLSVDNWQLSGLLAIIRSWSPDVRDIKLSGSAAKDLIVSGDADIDVFISLRSSCMYDLSTIYHSLQSTMVRNQILISKTGMAIGVIYNSMKVDLVPGKQQDGYRNYHSLYNPYTKTWIQSNIDEQIAAVKNSGRLDEIRLIKIWSKKHSLKFPSIYIEHAVLDALYGKNKNQLASNFETILRYLSQDFEQRRVVDPSNSNNVLSDYLLNANEKRQIASVARTALTKPYWEDIV